MIIHGYDTINDNYFYDYELTHFGNNVNQFCDFICTYRNEIKSLYDYAISHGLNENEYVISLIDFSGDDDIIITIFDKNMCFKWENCNDEKSTEYINNYGEWLNKNFNSKNQKIINVLMNNMDV